MSKGVFITATGTDIGKTYVSALLLKKLTENKYNCGYYKAALSGAHSISHSDAGYVRDISKINQEEKSMISYLYKNPLSPHLAAQIEGNPLEISKIIADYKKLNYDYILTEGSGGIICPLRYETSQSTIKHIFLADIIKVLCLSVIVVAPAGLGTINATTLTCEYLKGQNINIQGVILNNYTGSVMEKDNLIMIEELNNTKVIACVPPHCKDIDINADTLASLFMEAIL